MRQIQYYKNRLRSAAGWLGLALVGLLLWSAQRKWQVWVSFVVLVILGLLVTQILD